MHYEIFSGQYWKKQHCSQDERFKCYEQLFSELSVMSVDKGTVLLRGTQLCIPESLQQKVMNLAHEGCLKKLIQLLTLSSTYQLAYLHVSISKCMHDISVVSSVVFVVE